MQLQISHAFRIRFSLCASLVLTAVLVYAQAPVGGHAKGLPNFHRVNDRVYRGGQPTENGFEALRAMGIKTVLNLRAPGETSRREGKLLERWGVKVVNIAMPALGAPTPESVSQALLLLNDASAWPVFVHCQRGADRTGTVIACYRMQSDGWSKKQALAEAERFGLASFQTAKRNFILHWSALAASAVNLQTPGNDSLTSH